MGVAPDPTVAARKKRRRTNPPERTAAAAPPADPLAAYRATSRATLDAHSLDELEAADELLRREETLEAARLKKIELGKLFCPVLSSEAPDDGPVIVDDVPAEDVQLYEQQQQRERLEQRLAAAGPLRSEAEAAKRMRDKAADFLRKRQQEGREVEPPAPQPEDSVVYRDAEGRRITREEWEAAQKPRKKEGKKAAAAAAAVPWAKGLAKETAALRPEDEIRPGDPMAVRKTAKFSAPPNRFNIAAGARWDGVVRGNGFESRYLRALNEKKVLRH